VNFRAKDALTDRNLSPLWREMVARQVSQAFLDELLAIFGESIAQTYPSLARSFAEAPPRAGVRWSDTFETADVLLEAQPAANTPVAQVATSVRAGHLDNPNKLIVGLYYLRRPEDDSSGGDLQLYRYATRRPVFEGHEISNRQIELVKTIPYEANTLVLFLNSRDSLHGVTPRQPTPWPRLFLNLGTELDSGLFAMPTSWQRRVAERVRAPMRALASTLRG
jgi:2-oxoglutarate-Fe(II)-dependent oxygenase superfamily protein